jgi:NAD(P)-dependent dehydrogenase (short-subunit alcohol dehydrogenase family)
MPAAHTFQPASDALAGRTILVTGANGGLGDASARACAAAGATVVLLGRRTPKLGRLFDAIEASGAPTPAIYPLDLEGASPDDYAQLAQTIDRECGGLHGVLHAAAEFKGLASIENTEPLDLLRTLHVNLMAPVLLTQALLPGLRQRDDAAIVFVLDDPARIARAFWGAYAMAKHALAGVVAVLHDETENSTVRVHGLQPGPMRTALRARAFFAENPGTIPEANAYAPACVHLLGPGARAERGTILDVHA